MDYKKEIVKILADLKNKNHSRREIEAYLGYAAKHIDQILSKGGNSTLYYKLKEYKEEVEKGNIKSVTISKDVKNFLKASHAANAERAYIDVMLLEIAKLISQRDAVPVADVIDELEARAMLQLRRIEKDTLR
jgi:hypothetical protein